MLSGHIEIDGVSYPLRNSMGAYVDFYEMTGKEVYEIKGLVDACKLLYCVVKTSCEYAGVDFGLDFKGFANKVTPEDLNRWRATLEEAKAEETGGQKKSPSQSTGSKA